ncbi:hypothetical protein GW12_16000 [Acinetobacter sp. HR7]|nr:hypothetical protein GW12_16000 [Acinetobacter sp. HR7]
MDGYCLKFTPFIEIQQTGPKTMAEFAKVIGQEKTATKNHSDSQEIFSKSR